MSTEEKNEITETIEKIEEPEEEKSLEEEESPEEEQSLEEEKSPEKEENTEEDKPSRKLAYRELLERINQNRGRFALGSVALYAGMIAVAVVAYTIATLHPYAITVDDVAICYLENKQSANKAISLVVEEFTAPDTTLKAVDTEDRLKIRKENIFKIDKSELVSETEAAERIKAMTEEGNGDVESNPLEFVIASTSSKITKYIPEPNYVKGKKMIAGKSKVIKKGKAGKQKVSTTYISVNGTVVESDETATQILDAGVPATVRKGILGLPEGENWKTFEGDPIFKDGAELVITARKYVGKVRYKWGGRSLKTGVSCLGLVKAVYAKYGIYLPMSHPGMKKVGVAVSYKNAKKGDIICYKSHVGIYVGNGKMVDATSAKGISVRSVSKSKLVTVRRVVKK